jgi:hypothetical protein
LLDFVPQDGGDATQGDDLVTDELGMTERFLGITQEFFRVDLTPNPFDNEAGLGVLGDPGPLVLEAFVQLVDDGLLVHGGHNSLFDDAGLKSLGNVAVYQGVEVFETEWTRSRFRLPRTQVAKAAARHPRVGAGWFGFSVIRTTL